MARKDGKDRGIIYLCKKHRLLLPEKGECAQGCKDGVWWVVWFDQDHKKHREPVGTKTLAREVYQKRKTQVRTGTYFPDAEKKRRFTVKEAVQRYLDAHTANRSRKTDLIHARIVNDAFGSRPLEAMVPTDVQTWLLKRAEETSPTTANRSIQFLRRAIRQAVGDKLIPGDPTAGMSLLREPAGRDRYLLPDEETRLRKALPDRWWPLVELAYLTGLRRGEQFALRKEQVDLDRRVIRLGSSSLPSAEAGATKGGRISGAQTTEIVYLNSRAVELLHALLKTPGPWVFPNDHGDNHVNPNNWTQDIFRPALKAAGIKNFHWHDLKHTFSSRLVMQGVDIYSVMALSRHRDIKMTQRYAHLSNEHLSQAVERMLGVEPAANGKRKPPPAADELMAQAEAELAAARERVRQLREQKASKTSKTPRRSNGN